MWDNKITPDKEGKVTCSKRGRPTLSGGECSLSNNGSTAGQDTHICSSTAKRQNTNFRENNKHTTQHTHKFTQVHTVN